MRITILVLTCLISEAAVAAELSGQQLRLALIGQPIHWWEKDGWHAGEVVFLPDGRAEIFVDTPGSLSDVGRWHINGNQICTSWTGSARTASTQVVGISLKSSGWAPETEAFQYPSKAVHDPV